MRRGVWFLYQRTKIFEAVALCTFVLHVCAPFWTSFLFLKPNFFLLYVGEFDLIRRAHLLCILKRHHTYGVNTFVCSYSLNPNPSHSLLLSSLLDWQPYLLCGFPGFVTLLERRVRAPRARVEGTGKWWRVTLSRKVGFCLGSQILNFHSRAFLKKVFLESPPQLGVQTVSLWFKPYP